MKKIASLATLLLAAATLTACGADTLDGDYTGTTETEGITMQVDLTVKDNSCQLSVTAPILGEVPYECAIDQDSKTIAIDGEPTEYTVDGNTITLPLDDEHVVDLQKI